MVFFARLIDSWLWFVYFAFTSKETRQNAATAPINVKIIHSFWVLRACKEILFPVYLEIFPNFSSYKTSQHSKWMDNLNVDWSSGGILSCFFGREEKIHKPKPWINQACKEIYTATLGMKLTSVVCKLEIKINLSKSNFTPTPNPYPPQNV